MANKKTPFEKLLDDHKNSVNAARTGQGTMEDKYAVIIIDLMRWLNAEHAEMLRLSENCRVAGNDKSRRHFNGKAEAYMATVYKMQELNKGN